MTYKDVLIRFPAEKAAIKHYFKTEHPKGVSCSRCGSRKVYQEEKRWKVFYCNECKASFSPLKNTVFENTSTDIRKWMYAIHYYLTTDVNEISAVNLQAEIMVTYKTAWRMLKQIKRYEFDLH